MLQRKKKFLIIGQTPPPYGGQSINIERMLKAFDNNSIEYRLIRMNFSEEMNENGKASSKKVIKLFSLMLSLIKQLIFYRPDYVYYPPSGPEFVPVVRDFALLSIIRVFGKKIIFHFHAGGLPEIYPNLNGFLKKVFNFCYRKSEYAICLNIAGTKDPKFLDTKNIVIIPNGADDLLEFKSFDSDDFFKILFVGVCRESKGIVDFVEIIEKARIINPMIKGIVVGKIFSDKERLTLDKSIENGSIQYLGILTGNDKNYQFGKSDAFLFPTFFEHENFPTVILEAFSCSLPVISTRWRGVIDQISQGVNGYLIDVHDIEKASEYVVALSKDSELYRKMSINARKSFEENYSILKFEKNIIHFFKEIL